VLIQVPGNIAAGLPHDWRTYRAAPVTAPSTAAEVPTVTMPIAD